MSEPSPIKTKFFHSVRDGAELARDYQIPDWARKNTPENVQQFVSLGRKQGAFGTFAVGSDFTPEEEKLVVALEALQGASLFKLGRFLIHSFSVDANLFQEELKRVGLEAPRGFRQRVSRRLLLTSLEQHRHF